MRTNKFLKLAVISTLVLLINLIELGYFFAIANAQELPPPGVRPIHPGPNGYFYYNTKPGSTESGQIFIINQGSQTATYEIYPTNATTSPVSGVAYLQKETNPVGVASWIHIQTTTVTLSPDKGTFINFSVTVPNSLAPGDYVGSVAAQSITPNYRYTTESNGNKLAIVVSSRVVVAIVVHIAGYEFRKIKLGRPYVYVENGNRQVLTLPMNNESNVLMKPYLKAEVYPRGANNPVLFISRQLDTFVPKTSINYPWYINPPQFLPNGCYVIKEAIYYKTQLLDSRTTGECLGVKQTTLKSLSPTKGLPGSIKFLIGGLIGFIALLISIVVFLLLFIKRRDKEDKEIREIEAAEVDLNKITDNIIDKT